MRAREKQAPAAQPEKEGLYRVWFQGCGQPLRLRYTEGRGFHYPGYGVGSGDVVGTVIRWEAADA